MRVTRAQLRAQADGTTQIIHEDIEDLAQPLQQTSPDHDAARPVLKDITATNLVSTEADTGTNEMAPKKSKSKAKKGGKKGTRKNQENTGEHEGLEPEVLEDDNQSDVSEAAELATHKLKENDPASESYQIPLDTCRPKTPTTTAVREATRSLSKSPVKASVVPKTPRFDPIKHREPISSEDPQQDSFVGSIKRPSPFKMPLTQEHRDERTDSFVEQITSRSPSKPVSRIEDSVDAIDALEDAIEQIAQELPILANEELRLPLKKPASEPPTKKQNPKRKLVPSVSSSSKFSPSKSPARDRAQASSKAFYVPHKPTQVTKSSVQQSTREATKPRPSFVKPQSVSTAANPNAEAKQISFSNSPAKPRANMTYKRSVGSILSTSKTPFVPTKSSKPPTKSTFTLPGEAVAAKLKAEREEREERQKREEAGLITKPVLVTNLRRTISGNATSSKPPTRPSSFTLPGDAIAAKLKAQREARVEREGAALQEAKLKRKVQDKPPSFKARPAPAIRPRPSVLPRENKASQARLSLVQRHRERESQGSDKENVAPKPKSKPEEQLEVTKVRRQTNANVAAARRSVGGQVQRKETDPKLLMTMSKAEKEEAARKARAEAAERGRLASREWAERQKLKMKAKTRETGTAAAAAMVGVHV